VPARGRQTAVVTIPAFGRYTVRVKSRHGTALQLVDRMAGPGEVAGRAGETDGRLDLLLDRGEYQIVTTVDRRASGEAQLEVRPFVERHAPRAPLLVELKPVEEELADFEQASWWLDLQEPRAVWLEAAGRSLSDLRLWRDGTWLVDAEPEREVVQPVVGKPLLACRLAAELEPGLYLLTAYGGAPRPWASGDGGQPLHLRFGIPMLGEAGRFRTAVSAFGRDRFLSSLRTTFFRLEPRGPPAPEASLLDTRTRSPKKARRDQQDLPAPAAGFRFRREHGRLPHVSVSSEASQPCVFQR
jgi:hypothetical protein